MENPRSHDPMAARMTIPILEPIERTSTATKSEEEESQQIEADLQEEKIHALRNSIDSILGSLMPTSRFQKDQSDSMLMPGRIWIIDPYGDQGQYKGELDDNGMPHGAGDMIYLDGRKYEGQWARGQWHGRAKAEFQNGDIFEGEYKLDQRHGPGIYRWKDGRLYNGEFVEDKRHGRGEFRWPDSSNYHGEFENGHRHGEGSYTFPDGSIYSGSWVKSQMHGQGKCIWSDGRIFSGEWAYGKAHGLGKEIRPDGSVRHHGLWEEDRPIRKTTSRTAPSTQSEAMSPPVKNEEGPNFETDIVNDKTVSISNTNTSAV